MSYNRRFYLKRVLEAQLLVCEIQEKHKGIPMVEIYRQFIKNKYHISKGTFDRWMGVPAAAELKKYENERTKRKNK